MSDDFSTLSVNDAFAVIGANGQTKYAEMNKGITPIFFTESVEDHKETEQAGTLRMRDEERVRLFTSGDPNSSPVHPVTPEIKERFAAAYAEWKRTKSNDHIDGTPLKAWPLASRSFVMELEALHIRSVEQLAIISEAMITKIVNGREWKAKAEAWLDTNKEAGAAARYAAEAGRLREDNARLQGQLSELADRVKDLEAAAKSRRSAA